MRLPLPPGFPAVDLPLGLVAATMVTTVQTGLPGVNVLVVLPNGYLLSLVHGRRAACCGQNTVEAQIGRMVDRDRGVWTVAYKTPVPTDVSAGIQGWADGAWLSAALTTLAALDTST